MSFSRNRRNVSVWGGGSFQSSSRAFNSDSPILGETPQSRFPPVVDGSGDVHGDVGCDVGGEGREISTQEGRSPNTDVRLPQLISLIELEGSQRVLESIKDIIKGNFHGPWYSYKKIPEDVRGRMWSLFTLKYCWDGGKEPTKMREKMEHAFHTRGSTWLSKRFMRCRLKNTKAKFVSEENWKEMLVYWDSPEFKKKSENSKKNRNTEKAKQRQYYGGRCSVSEHEKRMEKKEQKKPTRIKVLKKFYVPKNSESSSIVSETISKYTQRLNQKCVESGGTSTEDPEELEDDAALYAEVVGVTKKRCFGMGSDARALSMGSCSSDAGYGDGDIVSRIRSEVEEQLKVRFDEEKAELKRNYEERAKELEEQIKTQLMTQFSQLAQGFSALPNLLVRPPNLSPNQFNPAYFYSSAPVMPNFMPVMPQMNIAQIPQTPQMNNASPQTTGERSHASSDDVNRFLNLNEI